MQNPIIHLKFVKFNCLSIPFSSDTLEFSCNPLHVDILPHLPLPCPLPTPLRTQCLTHRIPCGPAPFSFQPPCELGVYPRPRHLVLDACNGTSPPSAAAVLGVSSLGGWVMRLKCRAMRLSKVDVIHGMMKLLPTKVVVGCWGFGGRYCWVFQSPKGPGSPEIP